MSLLVASIVVATVMSASASSKAKKARQQADIIQKYSDLISIEEQAQTNAIDKLNMTRDIVSTESMQSAQASAMGKRASSASVQNMQSIARADMNKNFERMDNSILLSRKMGKLNDSARRSATSAANSASDASLFSSVMRNGLMLKGTGK